MGTGAGPEFEGIAPGGAFTTRFTVHQSGTTGIHSTRDVTGTTGLYGPIVIGRRARCAGTVPDRRYIVLLSDGSDWDPDTLLRPR